MPKFDALAYLQIAARERATHTMLVPVQYQRLMARPEFDSFDLGSFRMKFCTSAPFHAELKADVLKRWPGGLTEYYGMTEGGGTCILQAHLHPTKLHTVGQPAEGHDIRLIDENGREVAKGEAGEVVGRSGAMMTGYHKQPAKTAEAEWFDPQGNRFIRTGDVGRFDADGFMVLFDRRKDMVISGGFNIYPSDLEAILRQHPGGGRLRGGGCAQHRMGRDAGGLCGAPTRRHRQRRGHPWLDEPAGGQDPAPLRLALHRRAAAQRHRQGAEAGVARRLALSDGTCARAAPRGWCHPGGAAGGWLSCRGHCASR